MTDDAELLRRYAEEGSEDAFAELVQRNLGIVYSAARRYVCDGHRAEDVAQGVFIDLARKAGALRRHPALISWLYTSTRYAALKMIRAEQRRQGREREAQMMQETLPTDPVPNWDRLRPILDDVMHELGERERAVVLLRYFRGLPFAELAGLLQLTEGAARMRAERALDKMNGLLAKRGISSSAGALAVALTGQAGSAAPAGLAASVTSAALAGGLGGGTVGALGTLLIVTKLKIALAGVVVAGGLATALVEVRANRALQAEQRAIATDDSPQLQQENQRLRAAVAKWGEHNPEVDELTRLRARIATLKARPDGVVDAELHPPGNVGRATPAAAMETLCWAIGQGDLDLVASFVAFTDDSPGNREAFMANFSPAVRARYRTPERLCGAALYGAVLHQSPGPPVALQVVSVEEDHGPDQVRVKTWFRTDTGRELEGSVGFRLRADGWATKPVSLPKSNLLSGVRARIDPLTGDLVPPKPAASGARS